MPKGQASRSLARLKVVQKVPQVGKAGLAKPKKVGKERRAKPKKSDVVVPAAAAAAAAAGPASPASSQSPAVHTGAPQRPKRPKVRRFPASAAALRARVEAMRRSTANQNAQLQGKEATKEVSLATSKSAYIDPRVISAWCQREKVRWSQVYGKGLLEKFPWALKCDQKFIFGKNPPPPIDAAGSEEDEGTSEEDDDEEESAAKPPPTKAKKSAPTKRVAKRAAAQAVQRKVKKKAEAKAKKEH